MFKFVKIFLILLIFPASLISQDAFLVKRISTDYFWQKGKYSGNLSLTVVNQKMCDQNTEEIKSIARIVKRDQFIAGNKYAVQIMHLEVYDSETNEWKSIYSFPKKYKNPAIYKEGRDFFSLNFPTFNKIILSGRDSTGFIKQFARNSDNIWKLEYEYRTGYSKIFPTEVQMLGGNLGYAIEINYEGRNYFYRILKTTDCWRNFKELYRNKARTEDPKPELKLLNFLSEKFGKRFIALRKSFANKLVITTDDFAHSQEVDFTNEDDVQNIQLVPDSTIYIFTKSIYFKDKYKIKKSTNYGKIWSTIYIESGENTITNIKILDDLNIVLSGVFADTARGLNAYLKITNNGGKSWKYAFYSNESDIFFDFKNTLVPSFAKYKPWGHSLFHYNVGFLNGSRGELINLFEYYNEKLFICSYSHYNFDDSTLYPDKFIAGKQYTILENQWTSTDISYPPSLNYFEIDPYSYTFNSPKLQLRKGSKYLAKGDTLWWNKITGAKEYQIKIVQLGILNSFFEKEILNSTVKDTFLMMPQLSYGYTYLITAKSLSPKLRSQTSFLIAREPAEKLKLTQPKLLSPTKKNWRFHLDTLGESSLKVNWEPVEGAEWYNLSLFEVNYKFRENSVESKSAKELTPIIIDEKSKFNYVFYKNLKPKRNYELILFAENSEGISPLTTFYFVTDSKLGIFPISENGTKIFPNPVTDKLKINFNSDYFENLQISTADLSGKVTQIWTGKIENRTLEIDLSKLPAGFYYLLLDSDSTREAISFIKQ